MKKQFRLIGADLFATFLCLFFFGLITKWSYMLLKYLEVGTAMVGFFFSLPALFLLFAGAQWLALYLVTKKRSIKPQYAMQKVVILPFIVISLLLIKHLIMWDIVVNQESIFFNASFLIELALYDDLIIPLLSLCLQILLSIYWRDKLANTSSITPVDKPVLT